MCGVALLACKIMPSLFWHARYCTHQHQRKTCLALSFTSRLDKPPGTWPCECEQHTRLPPAAIASALHCLRLRSVFPCKVYFLLFANVHGAHSKVCAITGLYPAHTHTARPTCVYSSKPKKIRQRQPTVRTLCDVWICSCTPCVSKLVAFTTSCLHSPLCGCSAPSD